MGGSGLSGDGGSGSEGAGMVRPYARTGGRTKPLYNFAIEAMVISADLDTADDVALAPEHREIAVLCRRSKSVAEVSALLRMPIGVARVLLGDMAMMGLLTVHDGSQGRDRPDTALMERVLHGLHRL